MFAVKGSDRHHLDQISNVTEETNGVIIFPMNCSYQRCLTESKSSYLTSNIQEKPEIAQDEKQPNNHFARSVSFSESGNNVLK